MKNYFLALGVLCLFFSIAVPRAFAAFSFQAETTAEETTFGFRVFGASDFQVSWDGGATWEAPVSGNQLMSNDYGDAGTRNISVTGTAERIAFYGTDCTPALLTDITSKLSDGVDGINSTFQMFRDCAGITSFDCADWFDDISGEVTNMRDMFFGASNFNCPGVTNWNTSEAENLSYMFEGAAAFNQPIGNWDTSKVTDPRNMFRNAVAFNQDLSTKVINEGEPDQYIAWNMSKVTNIDRMFAGATAFNGNITNWNTSSVTDMSGNHGSQGTFQGAEVFNRDINTKEVTVGGETYIAWDVSNVTDMRRIFYDAEAFNQPLENWNTSKVTLMERMFRGAEVFNQDINTKEVTVGGETYIAWDMSNVTNLNETFYNAYAFDGEISDWDTSSVAVMSYTFHNASSFNRPITNWNTSKVRNMARMFSGAAVFNQDINTKEVTVGGETYIAWDVSNVTDMSGGSHSANGMLNGTLAFDQDISGWDVSAVTDFQNFLRNTGLSQANYDKLLAAWCKLSLESDITFHGGNSIYGLEGAGGRVTMMKTFDWTFTDGGFVAQAEYEVTNPMELQGCAMHPDEAYVVMNDIDLSETATWSAGAGFWPIGDDGTPFTGVFDGGGHALSGLHVNRPGLDYVGLFGEIAGTVSNVGVSGSVSGGDHVGGFTGLLSADAVVEDCYARVDVTAASDAAHRGGFVGRNEQGAIRRVYSTGSVLPLGGSNGGGLTGSVDAGGGYEDADNFWDTQTSGWETSAMGTGKTTREMQDIGTFEDFWNIESSMDEMPDRYPYLTGLAEPVWYIYVIPRGTIFNMR